MRYVYCAGSLDKNAFNTYFRYRNFGNLQFNQIQGLDKIKETPNILAPIFERVLNNQNSTYFNAFCLLFMSFNVFI